MFEEYYTHLFIKPTHYINKTKYTGQFHANLLALLHCDTYLDLKKLKYKYKYAEGILDPSHLAWFLAQLEKEDKENEKIKELEGTVDPVYSQQMMEIYEYMKKYKVSNKKELIMVLYSKLKPVREKRKIPLDTLGIQGI